MKEVIEYIKSLPQKLIHELRGGIWKPVSWPSQQGLQGPIMFF